MKKPLSSPETQHGTSQDAAQKSLQKKETIVNNFRLSIFKYFGVLSIAAFSTCCAGVISEIKKPDSEWYESPENIDIRNKEIIQFLQLELPNILQTVEPHPYTVFKRYFNFKGLTFEIHLMFDVKEDGSVEIPFSVRGPEGNLRFMFHNTIIIKPDGKST